MAGVIGSPWAVGQRGFALADDCPADCLTHDGNQVPKQATQKVFQLTGGELGHLALTGGSEALYSFVERGVVSNV